MTAPMMRGDGKIANKDSMDRVRVKLAACEKKKYSITSL